MIKKYLNFIKENKFGDYVQKHMENEDIKRLILPFLKGYETDLNISNIVELLDNNQKNEIKKIINNYINNGLTSKKNIDVSTNIHIEESSGKGVFSTFLKATTAINKKLTIKQKEEYIIYIHSEQIDYELLNSIFSRFKSLSFYLNNIKDEQENITLFFGLKDNLIIEYGLNIQDKVYLFGYFIVNNSNFNWLISSDFKSIALLNTEFKKISFEYLKNISKVKKDIKNIPIFDYKKIIEPSLSNGILRWGYYGVGTWNSGKLNEEELNQYKELVKKWILSNKWGEKVLFKLSANDFWLIIEIKNK